MGQNASLVAAAITDLAEAVANLETTLTKRALLPAPPEGDQVSGVAEGLEAISVKEVEPGAKKKEGKNMRKWFDTCFAQIDKVAKSIASELVADTEGS